MIEIPQTATTQCVRQYGMWVEQAPTARLTVRDHCGEPCRGEENVPVGVTEPVGGARIERSDDQIESARESVLGVAARV